MITVWKLRKCLVAIFFKEYETTHVFICSCTHKPNKTISHLQDTIERSNRNEFEVVIKIKSGQYNNRRKVRPSQGYHCNFAIATLPSQVYCLNIIIAYHHQWKNHLNIFQYSKLLGYICLMKIGFHNLWKSWMLFVFSLK